MRVHIPIKRSDINKAGLAGLPLASPLRVEPTLEATVVIPIAAFCSQWSRIVVKALAPSLLPQIQLTPRWNRSHIAQQTSTIGYRLVGPKHHQYQGSSVGPESSSQKYAKWREQISEEHRVYTISFSFTLQIIHHPYGVWVNLVVPFILKILFSFLLKSQVTQLNLIHYGVSY